MVNPFCGLIPLQRGITSLSIVQIVLASANLIQNTLALFSYVPRAIEEKNINANAEKSEWVEKVPLFYSMKSVLVLLNSLYWFSSLLLGILLYFGSKQRDLRKCRQYFILTCILTVLFIVDFLMQTFSMQADISEIISPVVAISLLSYMIWIVLAFMEEVRLGGCIPFKTPKSEIEY